jgi:hypothetical protein
MGLTVRKIEELAPDQASLNAASKLRKPAKWPLLAGDSGKTLLWGECQGSGSTPYRVMVALGDLGYKCTCPSRKFPCKHVLALLWTYVDEAGSFAGQDTPDWVNDWLGRRRPKSSAAPKRAAGDGARARASTAAVEPDAPVERDEKSEARARAQSERLRAAREASIRTGLDELQLWITDQLDRGLAAFLPAAFQHCRQAAQRLADAKAPGLSTWLDALPGRLLALPEAIRLDAAIEALGSLYLLIEAYRRQDTLPPALQADVRRLVGWTQQRDALLADPGAPRVKARWSVVATRSEVQPDRLRRVETWLARAGPGDGPRFAVLMDFTPVGTGSAASPFSTGEAFEAELVYYPSAAPLRAVIAERGSACPDGDWPAAATALPLQIERYRDDLARLPWLGDWPCAVRDAVVATGPDGMVLYDRPGGVALPITSGEMETLLPLVGLEDVTVFGLWDGRFLSLQTAHTPLGLWTAD